MNLRGVAVNHHGGQRTTTKWWCGGAELLSRAHSEPASHFGDLWSPQEKSQKGGGDGFLKVSW